MCVCVCDPSEASGEVPLRGGQRPERGQGAAGQGAAEAVRGVWLQGFLATRSEPRRDHHLPLRTAPVKRAGASTGLPAARRLHQGTVTAQKLRLASGF